MTSSVANPPIQGEPKNEAPFTNPVNPKTGQQLTPGINTVMNPDQIASAATSQVQSDINSQVAPLQSQLESTSGSEKSALQKIGEMFGFIMPYAAGAAQRVQGSYDEAEKQQQGIFTSAMAQLNQLKQSQAQRAQALAQEMGGPVALSEFTSGLDEQMTSLVNQGSGQMLHTLGYAQAGVQEANDFAGRVFPLVQTEQTAQLRNFFEDKKKQLQDQITSIKGQEGALVDKRKNELLVQERQYQLDKTNQALDQLKEKHSWQATQRTLRNDEARVRLAQREQARVEGETSGVYKGKPTLQAKQLTNQEKQQAVQLGLSNKEYQLRKQQLSSSTKLNTQRLNAAQRNTYAQWLDAAVNPQPGKTVTVTASVPVTVAQAMHDHSAYRDPRSSTGYSKLVKTTQTPTTAPITNPGSLVDYLVAHNVPKKMAINMVKARLRIPNWVYGEGDPNAPVGNQGRSAPGGITRPG